MQQCTVQCPNDVSGLNACFYYYFHFAADECFCAVLNAADKHVERRMLSDVSINRHS